MSEKLFEKVKFSSSAVIKVIGVGGGGGNALNTMIESGLTGVEFIAANTDVQALQSNLAPIKIQLGKELTKGLGAGANPDTGRNAALEDKAILQEVLSGADMVFVTGGMGGGTGTGAAPIIAQVARELGALTVGVVTKPFTFEGKRRKQQSELGIQALRQSVDTLITIPNQRLLSIAPPEMSMLEGFKLADEVLLNAVKGISDIINIPGRVNVDFADVKTIMSEMGMALMGIGSASGPNRAAEAARSAINSPLLEDIDIEGATGILINISGTSSMTLHEISEASTLIQEAAHEDANIIFGAVIDEGMGDKIRVTVIATGFDQANVSYSEGQRAFASMSSPNQFMHQGAQQPASQPQSAPHIQNQFNMRQGNSYSQPQFNQQVPQSPFSRQSQPFAQRDGTSASFGLPLNSATQARAEQSTVNTQQSQGFRSSSPLSANWSNTNTQTTVSAQASNPASHNHSNSQGVVVGNSYNSNLSSQSAQNTSVLDAALDRNTQHTSAAHNPLQGASAFVQKKNSEETSVDEGTESALKLARELSDIEIDDSDFETPAYLRRRDESTKA